MLHSHFLKFPEKIRLYDMWSCKIQLLKEHESKIELLGEAERNSVAAQDKLKKEIASIAAETEKKMNAQMEEQLHSVQQPHPLLACLDCTSYTWKDMMNWPTFLSVYLWNLVSIIICVEFK